MSSDPAIVAPGETLSVSLRLTNRGPSAVPDIAITSGLPPALNYQAPLGEHEIP